MDKVGDILSIIGFLALGFILGLLYLRNKYQGLPIALDDTTGGGIAEGVYSVTCENDHLVSLAWVGPNPFFIDIAHKKDHAARIYRFNIIPEEIRKADGGIVHVKIEIGGERSWHHIKSSSYAVEVRAT
jgi:hypothetical protein